MFVEQGAEGTQGTGSEEIIEGAGQNNEGLDPNNPNDLQGEESNWADVNEGNDWEWEEDKESASDYSNFLNEVGQDHINKMVDDYEKLTEMMEDSEAISKMSKEDVIRMYKTEESLRQELENIMPMLEDQKSDALNQYVDDIDNDWLKWYLSDLLDEMDSPEEMEAFMDVVSKITEFVAGSNGGSKDPAAAPLKKNLSWSSNEVNDNDIDPVQGMFSNDASVRKAAAAKMDTLLDDMFKAQYGR